MAPARALICASALAASASAQASVRIAGGIDMPSVLIGTGYMAGYEGRNQSETAYLNIKSWLQLGGRGIDTAYMYNCQPGIGQAIKDSGVSRDELFLLTKVPGTNGYDKTKADIQADLDQLGVTSLDVVLVHWCGGSSHLPGTCSKSSIQDTWKAMEEAHAAGQIKAIGISNFCESDLKTLLDYATVKPAVHQIERHPGFNQSASVAQSVAAGISVQGYGPLGDPDRCGAGKELMSDPKIQAMATAHGVTPAQVLLKWQIQAGFTVTPRVEKNNADHMKQNIEVMTKSFNLTGAEMDTLDTWTPSSKCWPVGVCGA